jgi:hypothetical protein
MSEYGVGPVRGAAAAHGFSIRPRDEMDGWMACPPRTLGGDAERARPLLVLMRKSARNR